MINSAKIIFKNIDLKDKQKLLILLFGVLIGVLFELIGIGALIPFLTIIIQDESTIQYLINDYNIIFLNNYSHNQIILISLSSIVFIYLSKTLFLSFLAWYQNNVLFSLIFIISKKIFKKYIELPYDIFKQKNSSILFRNITAESGQLVTGFLLPLIFITSEILILFTVSLILFIYEPVGFFVSIVSLIFFLFIFNLTTRQFTIRLGNLRQLYEGLRYEMINNGLQGFKSIKIFGVKEEFIKNYETHTINATKTQSKIYTFTQLPKFWVEFIGVLGVSLLVLTLTLKNIDKTQLLMTLGIFGVSAFRLIPSLNRIILSIQNMRSSNASLSLISNELSKTNHIDYSSSERTYKKQKIEKNINIRNIDYKHKNSEKYIFKNFSMTIEKNEMLAITGASGAGKSTLTDLVMGLLKPEKGDILVDEKSVYSNTREWQNNIGYVPQQIFLLDDSIKRNIAFGINEKFIDDEKVMNAIETAQLSEFVDTLPKGLNTRVGERGSLISGGQLQRIAIARALYNEPDLIVMDEATSALDEETEKSLMNAILTIKGTKTILIISHRNSTIHGCDREINLNNN